MIASVVCFKGEILPSCEDMSQEEGRAGQRATANPSTDSYTICLSLESLLILWKRIYGGTIDKLSYRKSLLLDVKVMLSCLVIPMYCIKDFLALKALNSFICVKNAPVYLPNPCLTSCSFCLDEYAEIAPPLNRTGVCVVLIDLFSSKNRISGDITIMLVLLDHIKKYPGCNQLIFGVNSNKQPAPILIKNAARLNISNYYHT